MLAVFLEVFHLDSRETFQRSKTRHLFKNRRQTCRLIFRHSPHVDFPSSFLVTPMSGRGENRNVKQ